jgi:DNA repair protein RadA/Sms
MAKTKTVYTCTECGGTTLKWQGQCPHCSEWNTLVETTAESSSRGSPGAHRFASLGGTADVIELAAVEA